MSKFHLFYGGPFSQWHLCDIVIDDLLFNCAEQYMMYKKAMMFGDMARADYIRNTSNPEMQKALGRQVHRFNPLIWDKHKERIVFDGNVCKFRQNPELNKYLLETGETELVEASPFDKIWGIGLAVDDPRAQDRSQWQGQNLLGKVLMSVRRANSHHKQILERLDAQRKEKGN